MSTDLASPRLLRGMLASAALALLVAFALIIAGIVHVAELGGSTTTALCALRADVQNRVNAGEGYLEKHPHGALGLSAATIRSSIANSRRTAAALRPIDCPPPPQKDGHR